MTTDVEKRIRVLVLGVVAVAAIGTVGSIVGRWLELLPAEAFGTVGEWTAGAAAIAAVLGISIQIGAEAAAQKRGQMAEKSSRLADRALQAAREVRLSSLHLVDHPTSGLALMCTVEQWVEQACGVERSLTEILILSASVDGANTPALQTRVVNWQGLSGIAASVAPTTGIVAAATALVAELEAMATAVVA